MTSIECFLADTLSGSSRIAILGVGSCLMADDAAGVLISDALLERFGDQMPVRFGIFSGGNAPECLTGVIKGFKPDHVILIDAADFGGPAGALSDIHPDAVSGVSFSTHMLPLKVMLEYLQKEIGCRTTILGIQPVCLEFCGELSPQVRETVDELIEAFSQIISKIC